MQHLGEITLVNKRKSIYGSLNSLHPIIAMIIDDSEALGEYTCDHWVLVFLNTNAKYV